MFGSSFSRLPNIHVLWHLPKIAINFGITVNVSVAFKEAVHGLYKRFVSHTNKKSISMDLSKRDNTLQTLRYLMDGGLDERYKSIASNLFKDPNLRRLLDNWYIKPSLQYHQTNIKEENSSM